MTKLSVQLNAIFGVGMLCLTFLSSVSVLGAEIASDSSLAAVSDSASSENSLNSSNQAQVVGKPRSFLTPIAQTTGGLEFYAS